MNVQQSINFIFALGCDAAGCASCQKGEGLSDDEVVCDICKLKFKSREQLNEHLDASVLPDIAKGVSMHGNITEDGATVGIEAGSKRNVNQVTTTTSLQLIDINNATILIEATVGNNFDSKRIKWLCRQAEFPLSKFIKSKSQCEDAIKRGRVFVNGSAALDSSRVVQKNDVVALVEEYNSVDGTCKSNNEVESKEVKGWKEKTGVKFVKEIPSHQNEDISLLVAYKEVGIRCLGSFSPNTLEMITKKQIESSRGVKDMICHSISKLDTGCAGLCVLAIGPSKVKDESLGSLKILYKFSVLVHGCPTEEWKKGIYVKLRTNGLRLWKRQKTNQEWGNVDNADNEHFGLNADPNPIVTSVTKLDLEDALLITFDDSFHVINDQGEIKISTLTVQSCHDDGRLANVISYILRKLGFPVVNDRFAKREFSALPRRMKNIMKQKICIGCFCLDVQYEGSTTTVGIESHKRTQCSFWREILSTQQTR